VSVRKFATFAEADAYFSDSSDNHGNMHESLDELEKCDHAGCWLMSPRIYTAPQVIFYGGGWTQPSTGTTSYTRADASKAVAQTMAEGGGVVKEKYLDTFRKKTA
jgi:hypothetical protein